MISVNIMISWWCFLIYLSHLSCLTGLFVIPTLQFYWVIWNRSKGMMGMRTLHMWASRRYMGTKISELVLCFA